jgi:magnesium chelatase subunit I
VPNYVREVVEEIAFQARADRKIDRRSASVSGWRSRAWKTCCRTRNAARWSTASTRWWRAWPTCTRRFPSITGKFEMEYEGELKGADHVARELIRASVANCVCRALRIRWTRGE